MTLIRVFTEVADDNFKLKKWQLVKKGRARITNPTVKRGTEPLHRKILTPKSKVRKIPGQVVEKRERNKEKFNKLSLAKVPKDKVFYKAKQRQANKELKTPRENEERTTVNKGDHLINKQKVVYKQSSENTESLPSTSLGVKQSNEVDKRNSVGSVRTGDITPREISKRNTPQNSALSIDRNPNQSNSKIVESQGRLSKQSVNTFNKLEVIPGSPEPHKVNDPFKRNITSQSHYKAKERRTVSIQDKPRSISVSDQYSEPGPSGLNTFKKEGNEFQFKAREQHEKTKPQGQLKTSGAVREQVRGKTNIRGKTVQKGKQLSNRRPKAPMKVNSFLEEETEDGKKLRYKLVRDTDEKSVQAELTPEYDDDFEDDDEYDEDDEDYDEDDYDEYDDDYEEDEEAEGGAEDDESQPQSQEMNQASTRDHQESQVPLPPIETNQDEGQYDVDDTPPSQSQSPQRTSRKPPVHERLYDPDFRKNRGVPIEPEPVYVREFKSKPPKSLEHVKSRHLDQAYFEPRGEYVLESEEENLPSFRARPPKQLEHVQSRILNPEYFKKKEYPDGEMDGNVSPTFVARPPKGLQHVQSRILEPKYFEEKKVPDDAYDKYNTEFKARLPKKLEHVQPRLLDPKKPKPKSEEEVFKTNFKAHVPKSMGHVESRIMDPSFYEPKAEYVYENDEEFDTAFKAKLPKHMQHVDTRIYDERFYKKKIPPISADQREAENMNTDFKAKPPKALQHVQSKFFDLWYEKAMSPTLESQPLLALKRKGSFVVINVKKDGTNDPRSSRGKSKSQPEKWRREFEDAIKPGYRNSRMSESLPERLTSDGDSLQASVTPEKKKPWKPKKKKVELVDRSYFDSWVMTPTHIYTDNNDMFDKNRQNVSNMWTNFAKSVAGNERQLDRYDKHLYY